MLATDNMFLYNPESNQQRELARSAERHEFRKRQHSDSSDDDASSPKSASPSMDDDRRAHHNELERRRRDHIKDHFMILKDSIPLLDGEKSSRALILKRAVEYISMMQSRITENQRNIEELRRKNELLEEKLKEKEPSVSAMNRNPMPTLVASVQPQIALAPMTIPNLQPAIQTVLPSAIPQNASPAALSTMDPMQLNNLIASSQEAIIALTQSLMGKMNTSPTSFQSSESITPPVVYSNNFAPTTTDRQMAVRF